MSRWAVMQPYLFPYLGYFQLVRAVDHFVLYDDVQYIKGGWINRNRMNWGGFTLPLAAGSVHDRIDERRVSQRHYAAFRRKFAKQLRLNYGRAPHYDRCRELVETILTPGEYRLGELTCHSVETIGRYLGTETAFCRGSRLEYDRGGSAQDRLLCLLRHLSAQHYVNNAGGRSLYASEDFRAAGVTLYFLEAQRPAELPPADFGQSILHHIAHHPPERIREWLGAFRIAP